MAKTRRYVEYLDGTVATVVVAAGDEERARRNGLKRTDDGYQVSVLWYAAKRNGLPFTDHPAPDEEDKMLAWLDQVQSWDMYITQAEADEMIAGQPDKADAIQKLVRDDLGEA